MSVDTRELMEALAILADERNIRISVTQSGKGTALCAACCFAGGLMLGPVGLAIGGAAGGIAAYKLTSGSFRPLGEVILNDLTDYQRERLVQHVTDAVGSILPSYLPRLLSPIMPNDSIQQEVLKAIVYFAINELKLQIID